MNSRIVDFPNIRNAEYYVSNAVEASSQAKVLKLMEKVDSFFTPGPENKIINDFYYKLSENDSVQSLSNFENVVDEIKEYVNQYTGSVVLKSIDFVGDLTLDTDIINSISFHPWAAAYNNYSQHDSKIFKKQSDGSVIEPDIYFNKYGISYNELSYVDIGIQYLLDQNSLPEDLQDINVGADIHFRFSEIEIFAENRYSSRHNLNIGDHAFVFEYDKVDFSWPDYVSEHGIAN